MKLLVNQNLDQPSWDAWLTQTPEGHFLQSWAWGEFQIKLGNPVWRIAVESQGRTVSQLLVTKLTLGYGWSLLYAPRGNLFPAEALVGEARAAANLILDHIVSLAKSEKCFAFRIDPEIETGRAASLNFYRDLGFVSNLTKNIQPRHTAMVDLTKSETALLHSFHSKTRYNIGLAERKEVVVKTASSATDTTTFLNLIEQTSSRGRFTPLSHKYYQFQLETLAGYDMGKLFLAHYQSQIAAGILTVTFNRRTTYLHGGSDQRHHSLMAPHLLQYQAMIAAKKDGSTLYDLWGIHPDPNHPWSGFTRFKRGFNGQEKEFVGLLELPTNPLLYKIYRWLRR